MKSRHLGNIDEVDDPAVFLDEVGEPDDVLEEVDEVENPVVFLDEVDAEEEHDVVLEMYRLGRGISDSTWYVDFAYASRNCANRRRCVLVRTAIARDGHADGHRT